jgi:uncharacterized protein (TIGR04255 family)
MQVAWNQNLSAVQLVNEVGNRLLTVGPDLLSVHILKPYPREGWEAFRPMIAYGLDEYVKVAAPAGVRRIGVRYINRVEVPERAAASRSEKYFRCVPGIIDGLPANLQAFLHRAEYTYDDGVKLVTTFATIDGQPDTTSFVLDIDVILECANVLPFAQAMNAVDDLRRRERDAFEAVVTDELRGLFDAEQS